MNHIEKRMRQTLVNLREQYGATAVKVSLEAEGIRFDELLRTREITLRADVGLTVKIGGCEALTDLRLTKMFGADNIMAPMIESKFALEKFLAMAKSEYAAGELTDVNLLINIESLDGYERIERILEAENLDLLSGIVLGRTDLSSAMEVKDTDDPRVLAVAKEVFGKAKQHALKCLVGGGVTPKTAAFLAELKGLVDGFETRKVVFGDYAKAESKIEEAIRQALTFEYDWYRWKQFYYGEIYQEDATKMEKLLRHIDPGKLA